MAQKFWQLASDGIVYAEPKGFLKNYYIYPPKYDEESPNDKYQLYLIEESGHFDFEDIQHFDTLDQAKKYALNHFKSIIKLYLCL